MAPTGTGTSPRPPSIRTQWWNMPMARRGTRLPQTAVVVQVAALRVRQRHGRGDMTASCEEVRECGAYSGVGGVSTVRTVLVSSRGDIGPNLDTEIRPGQRGLRDARDVRET